MVRKHKHLLVIALAVVSVIYFAPSVHAQGTYSCAVVDKLAGYTCVVENHCDPGYVAGECKIRSDAIDCEGGGTCIKSVEQAGLKSLTLTLYKNSLWIGLVLAMAILVFAGILYSVSAGNPSRISTAKKWIWAAIIGILILFSAYASLGFINPKLDNPNEPLFETQPYKEVTLTTINSNITLDTSTKLGACIATGKTRSECEDELAQEFTQECLDSGGTADDCYASCWGELSQEITNTFSEPFGTSEPEAQSYCSKYKGGVIACRPIGTGCTVGADASCCEGLYCEPYATGILSGECKVSPTSSCLPIGAGCTVGADVSCCEGLYCEPYGTGIASGACVYASFNLEEIGSLNYACQLSGGDNEISPGIYISTSTSGTKVLCDNNDSEPFEANPWCSSCNANGGIASECYSYVSAKNAGCCGRVPGECSSP